MARRLLSEFLGLGNLVIQSQPFALAARDIVVRVTSLQGIGSAWVACTQASTSLRGATLSLQARTSSRKITSGGTTRL